MGPPVYFMARYVLADEYERLRAEVKRETARADAMERAGAEQSRRADENLEVIRSLRAEVEALKALVAEWNQPVPASEWQKKCAEVEALRQLVRDAKPHIYGEDSETWLIRAEAALAAAGTGK